MFLRVQRANHAGGVADDGMVSPPNTQMAEKLLCYQPLGEDVVFGSPRGWLKILRV